MSRQHGTLYRFFWYTRYALFMEWLFLIYGPIPLYEKIKLSFKKYALLMLYTLVPVSPHKSHTAFLHHSFYFDRSDNLFALQSIFTHHARMFQNAHIEKVKTFVDVGSHIGMYSLFVKHMFPHARVYAVEPTVESMKLFKQNTAHLRNIIPIHDVLAEKNKKVSFAIDKRDSRFNKVIFHTEAHVSKMLTMRATTLDKVVKNRHIPVIDVLKIDVEGAEEKVLKGAVHALAHTRYIAIEINLKESSFTKVMSLLTNKFFSFQVVDITIYPNPDYDNITLVDCLLKNTFYS